MLFNRCYKIDRMIKAIIFDCYGVLLGQGFWHTYAAAGGNVEADKEFLHEQLSAMNSGAQSSDDFDLHIAEQLHISLEKWQSMKYLQELPSVQLFNFIRTHLKPRFKIGMISNASAGSVERRLSPEQLSLFDVLAISAEIGMLKPQPEIYQYTARKLGVEPDECIFIDDYPEYAKAAQAVGMQGIIYSDFDSFKREIEKMLAAK